MHVKTVLTSFFLLAFLSQAFAYSAQSEFASFDGWWNVPNKGEWGSADWKMSSKMFAAFGDGVYTQITDRPNPIVISDALFAQPVNRNQILSSTTRTVMSAFFGQFAAYEILDQTKFQCPPEANPIDVPPGHPIMDPDNLGNRFVPHWRSRYDQRTGQLPNQPRAFINDETSWIDGSAIYGNSRFWASQLRSFQRGEMASNNTNGGNLPILNDLGLPIDNKIVPSENVIKDSRRLFRTGGKRSNSNPALLALHILWMREHNFQAQRIRGTDPTLDDETVFMLARAFTVAELQKITYYDWLPNFIGQAVPAYKGTAQTSTAPGVTPEFGIAMRYGETMVPAGLLRRDNNCNFKLTSTRTDLTAGKGAIRMCNQYENSQNVIYEDNGIDNLLLGMISQPAEAEDPFFQEDIRVFGPGPTEWTRRDLTALAIQRGRDYGLPDYNTARVQYGLPAVTDFSNISTNATMNEKAREVFGNNLTKVDMFVGGMLESFGAPGSLFTTIFLDVFVRIRDADRWWFENLNGPFNDADRILINGATLGGIIGRNTGAGAATIQANVFSLVGAFCQGNLPNTTPEALDACTPLVLYDFFSPSVAHIPLIAIGCVLYIALVVLVLWLLVLRRKRSKSNLISSAAAGLSDTVDDKGNKLRGAIEHYEEDKKDREREVYCGIKGTKFCIYDTNKKSLREVSIDLISGVIMGGAQPPLKLLVQVPREYDIMLTFSDSVKRHNVFMDINEVSQKNFGRGITTENASVRFAEKAMKRKRDRKKEMTKFFRDVFSITVEQGQGQRAQPTKEMLEQSLSRDEFAEAFSIPKNSLFIQQLFGMVDKNRSGYVSFREFLDLMGVFYNGSSDDRLKFMFDLYDINHAGEITRADLAKMLESNMQISNVSHIEKDSINKMIALMYAEMGLEEGEKIKFKDFKLLMGNVIGRQIGLNLKDDLKPKGPIKSNKKDQNTYDVTYDGSATAVFNKQKIDQLAEGREEAQGLTVIFDPATLKKMQDGDFDGLGNNNSASMMAKAYGTNAGPKTTIQRVEIRKPRQLTRFGKFMAFMRDNRSAIFLLVGYILAGALVFGERAYTYSFLKEHSGLRRIAGYGVTTTRGAASAMMFNFSLLLATMCRNLFTLLRSGPLHKYIPFDHVYIFHKLVALVALFWVAVHCTGHFINFFHIPTQPADNLKCIFREVYHLSFDLPTFSYWFFATVTGFSGFLLVCTIVVMYVFSLNYSRRYVFSAFWTTHHVCAVILYILLVLHGSARLVQQPIFYIFFAPPAVLFIFDRLITIGRSRVEVPVIKAELLPSGVTALYYKRPDSFEYKSGQWIRIACIELSPNEYHPFTLTSAPYERHLSNHIRAVGPWTNAIREVYDPKQVRVGKLPTLFIDGPYGEGHQDWNAFEYVILVGGGIGVTPFASILKDVVHQMNSNRSLYMKGVYFFWVCRNQKQFEWLIDIIRECEEKDILGAMETHIFITELQQKYDLRTTMLYVCEKQFQKISKRSLFTGLRSSTHFGRPHFGDLFTQLQLKHSRTSRIGVFSCGPPPMTLSVDDGVKQVNTQQGPRFLHHFENF